MRAVVRDIFQSDDSSIGGVKDARTPRDLRINLLHQGDAGLSENPNYNKGGIAHRNLRGYPFADCAPKVIQ